MEDAPVRQELSFCWDKSAATTAAAAAFAVRVIGASRVYISHGEIQTGLSLDDTSWSPDLERLYAEHFAALGDERDLLVVRDPAYEIVGVAIVAWERSARRAFAVLEDMAIEPEQRSNGLGSRMLDKVEEALRTRGVNWLFLESGRHNEGAHRFFERHDFRMVSHVFAKNIAHNNVQS